MSDTATLVRGVAARCKKAIADDCLTHRGQQPTTAHKVGVLSRSQPRPPVVGLLPQPEHRVATRMRKHGPMKTVVEPVSTAHALADAVITAMLKADSDLVVRTVALVAEQFKRQQRYSPEEIDAAVTQVCEDLGIPWRSRLN
jgi:hypothetical protein